MYSNPKERIHSIMDFIKHFNTEEKCIEYLNELKYGKTGWYCYKCH